MEVPKNTPKLEKGNLIDKNRDPKLDVEKLTL